MSSPSYYQIPELADAIEAAARGEDLPRPTPHGGWVTARRVPTPTGGQHDSSQQPRTDRPDSD